MYAVIISSFGLTVSPVLALSTCICSKLVPSFTAPSPTLSLRSRLPLNIFSLPSPLCQTLNPCFIRPALFMWHRGAAAGSQCKVRILTQCRDQYRDSRDEAPILDYKSVTNVLLSFCSWSRQYSLETITRTFQSILFQYIFATEWISLLNIYRYMEFYFHQGICEE